MTTYFHLRLRIYAGLVIAAGVALTSSTACLSTQCRDCDIAPSSFSEQIVEASGRPNPAVIADRVSKQYTDKRYISFKSHVENHETIVGGWSVKSGGSISPGTVFSVIMSSVGDIRVVMFVQDQPVYEYRVVVLNSGAEGEKGKGLYLVHEYDHKNKIRTDGRRLDAQPKSMLLSHEALEHPAWCATGGYMTTFVGPLGEVADRNNEDAFANKIARGKFIRHERLPSGTEVDVIKFVQQEAAGPGKGPAGQTLEARPSIWWYIYVDLEKSLIVQEEGYFEKPGENPVLVRQKRFTDIEFPSNTDEETVFKSVPEAARSYRIWKPGEPYPVDRPHADGSRTDSLE